MIRAAIRRGELVAFRPGRRRVLIRMADLDRWLERHRVADVGVSRHRGDAPGRGA